MFSVFVDPVNSARDTRKTQTTAVARRTLSKLTLNIGYWTHTNNANLQLQKQLMVLDTKNLFVDTNLKFKLDYDMMMHEN